MGATVYCVGVKEFNQTQVKGKEIPHRGKS